MKLKFITYVGHKTNYEVYGGVFESDRGLVLQIDKHIEINKNKPPSKIASEEVSVLKLTNESVWDSFKAIDYNEYCNRWGVQFAGLKVK